MGSVRVLLAVLYLFYGCSIPVLRAAFYFAALCVSAPRSLLEVGIIGASGDLLPGESSRLIWADEKGFSQRTDTV